MTINALKICHYYDNTNNYRDYLNRMLLLQKLITSRTTFLRVC
jgi:hypothetical protein